MIIEIITELTPVNVTKNSKKYEIIIRIS